MKNKKIFFLLLSALILLPLVAAAQTGTYQTEDGNTVTYEGLVPCGKCVLIEGVDPSPECDERGFTDRTYMPCQLCHFFIMLSAIINYLIMPPGGLVWLIGLVMILIGGILMLVGGGSPKLLSQARAIFTSVAWGLAICLTAWIIVNTFFLAIGVADWTGLSATGSDRWFQIDCPVQTPSSD